MGHSAAVKNGIRKLCIYWCEIIFNIYCKEKEKQHSGQCASYATEVGLTGAPDVIVIASWLEFLPLVNPASCSPSQMLVPSTLPSKRPALKIAISKSFSMEPTCCCCHLWWGERQGRGDEKDCLFTYLLKCAKYTSRRTCKNLKYWLI